MSSWERDDAGFETIAASLEKAARMVGSDRAGSLADGGPDSGGVTSPPTEIVSPTSSSSGSNGSRGGGVLAAYDDTTRLAAFEDETATAANAASPTRSRRPSDEHELQFGEMEDEDDRLRLGRLALALDLDRGGGNGMTGTNGIGITPGPSSITRKTSSSFSDLGDYEDFMFADTTPNGTPNTPTFRSLYEANGGSFGRSGSYMGMTGGNYGGTSTATGLKRGKTNGRTTPTQRCGVPMDESHPIAGDIFPMAGEILRMEIENAAYIIFYKSDEIENDDDQAGGVTTGDDDTADMSVAGCDGDGEIASAFSRPPRSLISLGAAGHKVRTTNCFTRDYAHPTRSLGRGLFRASTSVGSAFLKGAAGLVSQTYQGGANGGVFGFAKGLGMGMLGLGTHTVKGAVRGVGQVTNVVGEMVMGTAPHFSIDGMLLLTNFRLIWVSMSNEDTMEIPLASIIAIDSSTTAPHVINIECKGLLRTSIAFRDETTSYDLLCSVWELYAAPHYVFATVHFQALRDRDPESVSLEASTNELYKAEDDYRRLRLLDETTWMRIFDNSDFSQFPSYPAVFIVPSELDDDDLRELGLYRSARRIPAVVWRHPHSGALMCRCAQPCAGLSGYVAEVDQKYVRAMQRATVGRDDAKFHFFDARSQMAAAANSAQGKGTEDTRNYPDTEIHFCDIGNIHAVRSSFASLSAVCQPGEDRYGNDWWFQLRNTFWFMHVSKILEASQHICQTMCQGDSVMVHCSDGWDRTSQLTALIQLLLDPHYRTLQGLMSIIIKEWCSFGHMFRSRYSHGEAPGQQEVEEQSPVFIQWLDSLWQIWRQQPWAFEFNDNLLAFLYDNVLSGLSGTFLYNTEKERREREAEAPTRSVWSMVLEHRKNYVNSEYDEAKNFNSVGIILPFSSEEEDLVLWEHHLVHADPVCRKYS